MSFNGATRKDASSLPVSVLQHRDVANGSEAQYRVNPALTHAGRRPSAAEHAEAELAARIRQERADAVVQLEQQLRQEYDQKLMAARLEIAAAIEKFEAQRADYLARVEAEVVQLSLAIAAKILHREAQIDPMLIATLVRMAVEKMCEGSSVTVRVKPGGGADWKRYFAAWPNLSRVQIVEDPQVGDDDCVLETELGSANFGIDAQLKEVERGFFDLLALRPEAR